MGKTIFLEIRNIILFFKMEKMYLQLAKYCQVSRQEVENTLKETGWLEHYEQGLVDSWALFHKLPPTIQGQKGFSEWMNAISDIFESNDSLIPLIKTLKSQQIKLMTLSNICEAHFSFAYTHFPILHLFEDHVLSYEVKLRKPDPSIYQEAQKRAKTDPKNCLHVDTLQECIDQANKLGAEGELYQTPSQLYSTLIQRKFLLP